MNGDFHACSQTFKIDPKQVFCVVKKYTLYNHCQILIFKLLANFPTFNEYFYTSNEKHASFSDFDHFDTLSKHTAYIAHSKSTFCPPPSGSRHQEGSMIMITAIVMPHIMSRQLK